MFSTNFLMFLLRNSPKYFSLAFRSLFLYFVFFFSVSVTYGLFLCLVYFFLSFHFSPSTIISLSLYFFIPLCISINVFQTIKALSPVLSCVSLFLSFKILTPTFKCAHDKKIRCSLNFEKYFTLSKPCSLSSRTKPTSL